jgi:HD-GYP domain-containing protein (c-di-GMP phosphodiesterase class II)
MNKVHKELWLLLSLVVIAALLNFLVSSQRVVLCFFFLPTLYSAYHFGRRHATLTALASVVMVVLLTWLNPVLFNRRVAAAGENPWFDLVAWGGILMVSGYAMGTLYERNQQSLDELKASYDGMMVILHHVLSHEKYSTQHAYRVSLCATRIAEAIGLDARSTEDLRTAALLQNVTALGISNDVLYKVANLSQEDLEQSMKKSGRTVSKEKVLAGTLQRAIPILMMEQKLTRSGSGTMDAALEVQILALSEAYESLISETGPRKMSPAQAEEVLVKSSGKRYDSMVVNAFVQAFGKRAEGAGAP